jgi:N-methylhydantoinase A/oxoprolinase/acetone carboxylase beta subunit
MSKRRIKIGIDVGGTFTHAVAVDAESLSLAGTTMVPTTHHAPEGVARGVVDSMRRLLEEAAISPEEIVLIAHSTTQATNALLEGDVAPVGIIGMGKGVEGWRARSQTRISDLELAPGKILKTCHRFIDTQSGLRADHVLRAADELLAEGAQVFVASEAFGVDDLSHEEQAVALLEARGHLATSASSIARLYGLRIRTRTAVINASMMPKMLETAAMTEKAVRESNITAPLMIMRSDGGIMSIDEMRRRPILTMLSGPAAGVAAALMFVKISDGIFLEVGGTSTDISVIKNGRPTVRSARVGGHRLYVRTLDVRTVGIGGGSMPRLRGTHIHDVGPRSAHIAGLRYPSFADPGELGNPRLILLRPRPGDPDDYLGLSVGGEGQARFTFTTTDAANIAGDIHGYGRAAPGSLDELAPWLASQLHTTPQSLAQKILHLAAEKVALVVRDFASEYRLDTASLALVGGGGGAEVIVPSAARVLRMEHRLAGHAEVISAIGAALGMIQDTVEQSVVNPTEADLLRLRNEALHSVLRMGASPESVDVRVEVDTRQKRISATARGVPELRTRTLQEAPRSDAELAAIAALSCGTIPEQMRRAGETPFLKVFVTQRIRKRLLGAVRIRTSPARVLDTEGVIRLKLPDALVHTGGVRTLAATLPQLLDANTTFGDAGGLQPDVYVMVSARIIDLSGLVNAEQVLALFRAETETFGGDEPCVILLSRKQ